MNTTIMTWENFYWLSITFKERGWCFLNKSLLEPERFLIQQHFKALLCWLHVRQRVALSIIRTVYGLTQPKLSWIRDFEPLSLQRWEDEHVPCTPFVRTLDWKWWKRTRASFHDMSSNPHLFDWVAFFTCRMNDVLKQNGCLLTFNPLFAGALTVGLVRQCQTIHGRDRTCIPPRLPPEWVTTLFFIIMGIISLTVTCGLLVASHWRREATKYARWIAFTGSKWTR